MASTRSPRRSAKAAWVRYGVATDTTVDRQVAIKILPDDAGGADRNFALRFRNEAQAMAQLSHPGIVAVHDFGQTSTGLLYIVMEFIEGTDVQKMIAASGRLSVFAPWPKNFRLAASMPYAPPPK